MSEAELLIILKADLQILNDAFDTLLTHLLNQSALLMEQEGIIMDGTLKTQGVQIQYAAYLFRRRGIGRSSIRVSGEGTNMPRFLRYELNNLIMEQKAGVSE